MLTMSRLLEWLKRESLIISGIVAGGLAVANAVLLLLDNPVVAVAVALPIWIATAAIYIRATRAG